MSKVDILIPAFNAAPFLRETLESVLAQTEQDWRILLVDDGSTDQTRVVVERFLQDRAELLAGRLTYLFQQNRGVSAARNAGIVAGSSPLIAMLDADDLWVPTRLEDSLRCMESDPEVGLSYGGVSRFLQPGTVLDTYTTSNPGRSREETSQRLYTRAVSFPCLTVTVRRNCVERVGLFDETMHATEDRDLWLRIAQQFPVTFLPRVLGLYRLSANSATTNLPRMLLSQQKFIEKHRGELGCGLASRSTANAGAYVEQALGYGARGERGKALRFASRAVLSAPWSPGVWRASLSAVRAISSRA